MRSALAPSPTRAAAEPLPAATLDDIAAGFAAASPLWRAAVCHDPEGRRPARLIATDRYEVWVIGWTTGQRVRLHDHGPSAGAVAVAEGALVEVLPVGGSAVERPLVPGRTQGVPVGTVHDVVNRGVAPATSIHVYSPPLTTMTYYDPATLAPVGTEAVAPERARLAPAAAARVLHPSRRRAAP